MGLIFTASISLAGASPVLLLQVPWGSSQTRSPPWGPLIRLCSVPSDPEKAVSADYLMAVLSGAGAEAARSKSESSWTDTAAFGSARGQDREGCAAVSPHGWVNELREGCCSLPRASCCAPWAAVSCSGLRCGFGPSGRSGGTSRCLSACWGSSHGLQ